MATAEQQQLHIIIYKTEHYRGVVGFAHSIDEFLELNAQRSYPYNYPREELTARVLTPDVFAMARIEGQSNFIDYLK